MESKKKDKLLPVMVFIHYGGNFAGTSQPERSGPEFFMDRQVLMVSFNYRLGIFGKITKLYQKLIFNFFKLIFRILQYFKR